MILTEKEYEKMIGLLEKIQRKAIDGSLGDSPRDAFKDINSFVFDIRQLMLGAEITGNGPEAA